MTRTSVPAGSPTAALSTATTASSLTEAALAYAQAGIPVFPCEPEGKAPLTRRGFHDAASDPQRVTAWWRRHPQANIGVPTGAASGLDVVDIDVHQGGSGFAAFERGRRAGLLPAPALLVRTPSGGVHAYFPHDDEQRSWACRSAHVDFRGDGGYVVAPPSLVRVTSEPMRPYALMLTSHGEPAPVNATALREFLSPAPQERRHDVVPVAGMAPGRLAEWVASRPEGARNGALFWAACRMVEDGFDRPSVSGLLGAAATRAGLPEREVRATIRSAFRTTTPQARAGGRHPSSREAVSL